MRSLTTAAFLALAGTAGAQTHTPETEPNDTKYAGTMPAACLRPGDTLGGNSTGTFVTPPGGATPDNFFVTSCTAAVGLYRSRLTLTTAGPAEHVAMLRGLNQAAGAPIVGGDGLMQTSTPSTTPPRMVQWYSFGKGEQYYYRVEGTAATTADYVATYTSTAVAPVVVPGTFVPGTITVSSVGQTTTDTEIYVYDANYDPVPTMHNDDVGPNTLIAQSTIARPLSPGVYHVAISRFNLANDQPDANPDEDYLSDTLHDWPNLLTTTNSLTGGTDVSFTISDGTTTIPVTATTSGAFDVYWARFTVGAPIFAAFCAGDGTLADHTTPCPCGNNGAAGNGCANSANAAGANLTATGTAAADDVVLNGSSMPMTVFCIYLQGDGLADDVFGDGVRCAGGELLRLRTRGNVGGASAFPDSTDTMTLSARGGVTVGSGARRHYQIYYRNGAAAFCPPGTFNITNGWTVDW